MMYVGAITVLGFVALLVVAHGARIMKISERRHRAARYFVLGTA